jgi:hypothetical protein
MAEPLVEEEVNYGRRAFPEAQALLGGGVYARVGVFINVGWYDTETHPEAGAFAVVRPDGPHVDLVGEILKVTAEARSVFVYVVSSADIPPGLDMALYRRAFLGLAVLARESISCMVEIVE